jgi:hypothetical protein
MIFEGSVDQLTNVPVTWAYEQGYHFLLTNDGEAEVISPIGTVSVVSNFHCTCGDPIYHASCLHALWVRQLRPCELCGSIMQLTESTTCFGESQNFFQCPSCANARDMALVKEERLIGLQNHRLTPQGRCEQALAWLNANGSEWYIWKVVYQSPELIATMITVLSETDHHMLADRIVSKAGFKAA